MTLKEYAYNINKYLEENPSHAELDVVTSIDDEGNGYNRVHYTPSAGEFLENSGEEQICVN